MTTSTLQLRVSLLNITLLTLLAAVALCGTVAAGFALIGDDGPLRALMSRPVYLGLTILLIVELVYLGFAVHVGARQVRAGVCAVMRSSCNCNPSWRCLPAAS